MTLPCVYELATGFLIGLRQLFELTNKGATGSGSKRTPHKGAPGHLRSRQRRGGWDCNSHSPHWLALSGERRQPASKVNIQGHLLRQCPNFCGRRRWGLPFANSLRRIVKSTAFARNNWALTEH